MSDEPQSIDDVGPDSVTRRRVPNNPSVAANERAESPGLRFEPALSRDHEGEKLEIQKKVAAQEARKLKARSDKQHAVWFGLGMFGLVGWSVAIPAVVGVAIGVWIDSRWPNRFSWALMLLLAGMALGCWNAWNWLHREGRIDE